MDNEAEYKFLKFADSYFTDTEDYYLGGTTNAFETQNFKDYIPNNSGKLILCLFKNCTFTLDFYFEEMLL